MAQREKLVTLGDATLHTDDLALLVPPAWLNDSLISFWVEHLRLHVLCDATNVTVLPPNISFFLTFCNDDNDTREILSNLRLSESDLILITVNDSRAVDFSDDVPSGSHWSLLVFERQSTSFYYLDSMSISANKTVAKSLCSKLKRLMKVPGAELLELSVPKQENTYDCGAYVCMYAEDVIVNFQSGKNVNQLYEGRDKFTPDDVESKRQEIGKLACRLLDKQQRADREKGPVPGDMKERL